MAASPQTSIVWFRRDLRLADNPAWNAALRDRGPICALYVVEPDLMAAAGRHRADQFRGHVIALDAALRSAGGALRLESGDPAEVLPRIFAETGAERVLVNADTTPHAVARDARVAAGLQVPLEQHWGTLVHRPGSVLAGTGRVSRVFTPFHRTWEATPWAEDELAPPPPPIRLLADPGLGTQALGPSTGEPAEAPGEAAALERLAAFGERVDSYLDQRDFPAIDGTAGLSVDLHFGTLSPRRVITEIGTATPGRAGFVRQLAWRDWYAHLLAEVPHLVDRPLDPEVGEMEWVNDPEEFAAWSEGRTGYPIVDAGMRELAATGRMHNRVRMITASFLVKDLLIDWRRGERWFRQHLLDGDVAQNVGNWQWAAGTGPDSAPFFRVFNPWLQSRKFDTAGEYIRRWVPELAGLSAKQIHAPAEVGPLELAAAGLILGEDYPWPIVDHAWARDRALAAYAAARAGGVAPDTSPGRPT